MTTTENGKGTIRKYFPNLLSTGMGAITAKKRMADELGELGGAGAGDAHGAGRGDENDDGAAADGQRKKLRCTTMTGIDGQEPLRGAKSGSGKILLGLDSDSSQGNGWKGSWKLGIVKKNLEVLDRSPMGIPWKGQKNINIQI